MKVVILTDYDEIGEMKKNPADVTYQRLTESDGFGH